jgi:hypothetical protein
MLAVPILLYVAGDPTVGAVLMLSSVLVLVTAILKSGALSPSWLQRESFEDDSDRGPIRACVGVPMPGLAVDALFGGVLAMRRTPDPRHVVLIVILTVAAFLVIGAGLFSTRWFAVFAEQAVTARASGTCGRHHGWPSAR